MASWSAVDASSVGAPLPARDKPIFVDLKSLPPAEVERAMGSVREARAKGPAG